MHATKILKLILLDLIKKYFQAYLEIFSDLFSLSLHLLSQMSLIDLCTVTQHSTAGS